MQYRKLKADQLFTGFKLLDGNHVLVIDEYGVVHSIIMESEAGKDVEQYDGILTPGFINCHCHLELSHMKGLIPQKTGLVDFIFKIVTERHHAEEDIIKAVAEGEDEMLRNGIVAVGDICNNTLTLSQKKKGRLQYYNFIEVSGWLPSLSGPRFQRALEIYHQFLNANQTIADYSIVPHASYSVSENLWQQIQPYFEKKVVSIHNQETSFEDDFFLQGTGDFARMYQLLNIDNAHHQPTKKTSLKSYFNKLEKADNIMLVHNTFTTQEDIAFVQKHITHQQLFWCLCVNANQYIENALPPVDLFRNNGCTIVLGTDSLASNQRLNIADEIKTIQKNFPSVPLEELLQWATINGARALQMDHELGSFKKGHKPGINILNEKTFEVKRII